MIVISAFFIIAQAHEAYEYGEFGMQNYKDNSTCSHAKLR